MKKQQSTTSSLEPESFLSAWRRIGDRKLAADEAKAGVKAAVATARHMGTDLAALKFVGKLAALPQDEARSALRNVILYAAWLDLGLGDQRELFDLNSDLAGLTGRVVNEHRDWEAERAGYEAGKADTPLDANTHTPGSSEYERWVVGWHDGAATRKAQIESGIIKPKQQPEGNPEDRDDG